MPRVVCAGHVNWDITLRVDRLPEPDAEAHIRSQSRSGGGSAANVAVGLTGLDVDATLVGSVGDDEYGLLAGRALETRGVDLDLTVVEGGQTAVKYLVVAPDGEVAVLGTGGDNEAVGPADVGPSLLEGADHLHLTSQHPETAGKLAKLAAERGVFVSFDPGRRIGDRDYGDAFGHADLVFFNEREASTLGGGFDDRLVVTKYGPNGAVLETPDALYRHGGFSADAGGSTPHPGTLEPTATDWPTRMVTGDEEPAGSPDSAGAGDAFSAGFIASLLSGDPPERALAVGNACGTMAAREPGAQVDLSWRAVSAMLEEP